MKGILKRGRPLGSSNDKVRRVSITVRVTEEEKQALERRCKELDVPLAGIFHGFVRQISQRRIADPIFLTVDETPVAITRSEAKDLLLDLTHKLINN
ncbi:hypothetical protein M1B72_13565 [Geomonas paludis]|uniref:CopG family transcriptional regulator n=1 Tax=Geomonas paludis TaxID=2740185 RepID=A0ABY4LDF0_9BACT|nr:hypothetical protein [Geomonas paludis]UPU34477.1 hypothetical protein M1B72_13565 [Geomonas paludis]